MAICEKICKLVRGANKLVMHVFISKMIFIWELCLFCCKADDLKIIFLGFNERHTSNNVSNFINSLLVELIIIDLLKACIILCKNFASINRASRENISTCTECIIFPLHSFFLNDQLLYY